MNKKIVLILLLFTLFFSPFTSLAQTESSENSGIFSSRRSMGNTLLSVFYDLNGDTPNTAQLANPGPNPNCDMNDAWTTLAHDSQRTGASGACIGSNLNHIRVIQNSVTTVGKVMNVIADASGIYIAWLGNNQKTQSVYEKMDHSNNFLWSRPYGVDFQTGIWPTIIGQYIYIHDNATNKIDKITGAAVTNIAHGIDYNSFGLILKVSDLLFATVNSIQYDASLSLYLHLYDVRGNQIGQPINFPEWERNKQITVIPPALYSSLATDNLGGALATDGTSIIYSALYNRGEALQFNLTTGIYSFDLAGNQKWFKSATPLSHSSIKNGYVYTVEGNVTITEVPGRTVISNKTGQPFTYTNAVMTIQSERVRARKISDGTVVWASEILPEGASIQSPILSNNLAIVSTNTTVEAYDQLTGAKVWSRPITGASIPFMPSNGLQVNTRFHTSMAAAEGSNTLIVAASSGLYGLSITTGVPNWTVAQNSADWTRLFPNVTGRLFNPVLLGRRLFLMDGFEYANTKHFGKLYIIESTAPATPPPPPPPSLTKPDVNLSIDPIQTPYGGEVVVSWQSATANSCVGTSNPLNPTWDGTKFKTGIQYVTMTENATITITCSNSAGSTSQSQNVIVTTSPPPTAPILNFTSNVSAVSSGGGVILTWSSANLSSCQASASPLVWSGSKPIQGAETVYITSATNFTLACIALNGSSIVKSITVGVQSTAPLPIVTLTASPMTVPYGTRTKLTWTSTNATSCIATGRWTGAKALSGTQNSVIMYSKGKFNLQCSGPGGSTTKSVIVNVI